MRIAFDSGVSSARGLGRLPENLRKIWRSSVPIPTLRPAADSAGGSVAISGASPESVPKRALFRPTSVPVEEEAAGSGRGGSVDERAAMCLVLEHGEAVIVRPHAALEERVAVPSMPRAPQGGHHREAPVFPPFL